MIVKTISLWRPLRREFKYTLISTANIVHTYFSLLTLSVNSQHWDSKKILFDEVNYEEKFYTCSALDFSIYNSSYTEGSTIYNLNLNNTSLSASTFVDSAIGSQHTAEK